MDVYNSGFGGGFMWQLVYLSQYTIHSTLWLLPIQDYMDRL